MRTRMWLGIALTVGLLGASTGCATRDRPYPFTSPMLGAASVPPRPLLPGAPRSEPGSEAAPPHPAADPPRTIRVATAPTIREASARAASQIAVTPRARPEARAALAAPHRAAGPGSGRPEAALPSTPDELRALVGRRERGDATAIVIGWARALGATLDGRSGEELIAWAMAAGRLAAPTERPVVGDLLVFDHAVSDHEADLIAIVLGRDERGVIEVLYVGGGVVRRGFVDPARPKLKRDDGQRVVNTFLRHGRRWPARGTRYLTGELLAHVVHTR